MTNNKTLKKEYRVLKAFDSENKPRIQGDIIRLSTKQSIYLLTGGFIELNKPQPKQKSSTNKAKE